MWISQITTTLLIINTNKQTSEEPFTIGHDSLKKPSSFGLILAQACYTPPHLILSTTKNSKGSQYDGFAQISDE
jgi:hypothetical protein